MLTWNLESRSMTSDSDRVTYLRSRRQRLIGRQERFRKKAKIGQQIVNSVNRALNSELTISSFRDDRTPPVKFALKPNIADCSGLVAAYRTENNIRSIISCCDNKIGPLSGSIEFVEYGFMGVAAVTSINLLALLELAKLLHDTILFYSFEPKGVFVIDYYVARGVGGDLNFSFVFQGVEGEVLLSNCFQNVIPLA